MVLCLCMWDDLRGARQLGAEHRATYLYSVDPRDLDHDAVMRIGGRAPERWAHSTRRPESHSWFGSPPPRIVIECQRHLRCRGSERVVDLAGSSRTHLDPKQRLAGCHETPKLDPHMTP